MNRDPDSQPERMPTAEDLKVHVGPYIKAMVNNWVDGQGSRAAQEARAAERADRAGGSDHLYSIGIGYKFTTTSGDELSLRFRHHMPHSFEPSITTSSISWSSSRGQAQLYANDAGDLMPLYTDSGSAWFGDRPLRHADEAWDDTPGIPGAQVLVPAMPASPEWLERFLGSRDEAYKTRVRQAVADAMARYEAGYTTPIPCENWFDAEAQLNRRAAQALPEYLMHLFAELSQATGIEAYMDWVRAQINTDAHSRSGHEDTTSD